MTTGGKGAGGYPTGAFQTAGHPAGAGGRAPLILRGTKWPKPGFYPNG